VGAFPDGATPEGVFDLAGNVAEWVLDRYAPEYAERDLSDPTGPSAGSGSSQRVVRGGDYESPRPTLRGAARLGQPPGTRAPTLGFRCAKPVHEAPPRPETPLGSD
jgi:formylglycine-generating enzyme